MPHQPEAITDAHRARAQDAASLDALTQALRDIEAWHRENGTGVVLHEGADAAALDALEARIGCVLPLELRTLWGWKNGEQTDRFIWYHRFLPLEAALAERETLTSEAWGGWPPTWIPVFEFEGEWYGVECGAAGLLASPVVHYFIEDEPRVSHTNLTAYMQTMAAATREGALTWKDGWWEDDPRRLSRIHAALNPGLGFPYYVPPVD
ncbi:MAG: SMI1/KNR4 family protein [Rhodothermales bacterium]|nr:SMI1/KNR4 family protein [Rhodothermales bacterium]